MMLKDVAMCCDDLEGNLICWLTDPLGWGLGKHSSGAYPELLMECYGYLQVKHMWEHICEVQAKGAACWHHMSGVEADVGNYVLGELSEKVIFL